MRSNPPARLSSSSASMTIRASASDSRGPHGSVAAPCPASAPFSGACASGPSPAAARAPTSSGDARRISGLFRWRRCTTTDGCRRGGVARGPPRSPREGGAGVGVASASLFSSLSEPAAPSASRRGPSRLLRSTSSAAASLADWYPSRPSMSSGSSSPPSPVGDAAVAAAGWVGAALLPAAAASRTRLAWRTPSAARNRWVYFTVAAGPSAGYVAACSAKSGGVRSRRSAARSNGTTPTRVVRWASMRPLTALSTDSAVASDGMMFTSMTCGFSAESSIRSKPKSSKHPRPVPSRHWRRTCERMSASTASSVLMMASLQFCIMRAHCALRTSRSVGRPPLSSSARFRSAGVGGGIASRVVWRKWSRRSEIIHLMSTGSSVSSRSSPAESLRSCAVLFTA
mmetsp:Transcript_35480/g.109429  ORF Transcript_35480/g.109429 Transcript_35480/m.109429 type:complete len:399 (+) Transcript_35480:41-1237(+)